MVPDAPFAFDDPALYERLMDASAADLDAQPFGVIGFDADWRVRRYNRAESRFSGLAPESVLGHGVFTVVAPCLDNPLVARRFEDAVATQSRLDATIDYVLTWRMRPTPVWLRLLSDGRQPMHFLAVQHLTDVGRRVAPLSGNGP